MSLSILVRITSPATEFNNKSYKYWHNYAMFNYKCYKNLYSYKNSKNASNQKNFPKIIDYATNAINGLFKLMNKNVYI